MGALEQRLAETENALLQLLSTVNDETLELAFSESNQYLQGGDRSFPQTTDVEVPGGAGSKKANSVANWEKFPLKTAQDVKYWASMTSFASIETRAGARQSLGPSSSAAHDLEDSTLPPLDEVEDFIRPTTDSFMGGIRNADDIIYNHDRPGSLELAAPTRAAAVEEQHLGPGVSSGERQPSHITDSARRNQEEETVDLPLEFREQFLW